MILQKLFVFEFRAVRRNSAAIFGAGFWSIYGFSLSDIWTAVAAYNYLAAHEVL